MYESKSAKSVRYGDYNNILAIGYHLAICISEHIRAEKKRAAVKVNLDRQFWIGIFNSWFWSPDVKVKTIWNKKKIKILLIQLFFSGIKFLSM